MIATAMPTIVERKRIREMTIEALRNAGIHLTAVVEQHPLLPLCGESNLITTKAAMEQALQVAESPTGLLVVEDDVHVDERLKFYLDIFLASGETVSLWHRPRFLPAKERRSKVDAGPRLVQAIGMKDWFGNLAILYPLDVAEAFIEMKPLDHTKGADIHLREVLAKMGRPLLLSVPSMVEHREGARYATKSWMQVRSEDYEGPLT